MTVASLPVGAAVDVGTSAAEDLLDSLGSILPVPMDGATLPNPAADVPVKARSLGGAGWEVVLTLPRLELTSPLTSPTWACFARCENANACRATG